MAALARRGPRVGGASSRVGLALLAVLLVVFFEIKAGGFVTGDNITTILLNSSSLLIASIAVGCLVVAGNIDLSIAGQYAFISLIVALVVRETANPVLGVAAGLAMGAALGWVNGTLVRLMTISPIIVTLATGSVYAGMAYVVNEGTSVYNLTDSFLSIARSDLWFLPMPVVIALVVFVLGGVLLTRTVAGVRTYAIGGNAGAARLAGVQVERHVTALYVYCGLSMGLVATLTTAQLASGTPQTGVGFELDVLTAVILGGVGFAGGTGRPLGIFIGVVTIGILNSGLVFLGLQDWWQQILKGGVLLLALGFDQYAAIRRERRALEAAPPPAAPDLLAEPIERIARDHAADGAPVAIAARELTKRYGAVAAVTDASFAVRRGEIVCLVGDNGAGKSTLIKMLSGAVRPTSGGLELAGRAAAIGSPADARAAGIETVHQDLGMCTNLGAALNLALGSEPRGKGIGALSLLDFRAAERIAQERLATLQVRLDDLWRPVGMLSGGQRQSVAIARVAGPGVSVVILDEPTAALSVRATRNVLDLVRRLADGGAAVILISHDLEDVLTIADRIVVLRLGRVAFDGEAKLLDRSSLLHVMAGLSAGPQQEAAHA